MATLQHKTAAPDMTITETHCPAAELVWDEPEAARFRELMGEAVGRDCVCHEGESCWLMDSALKGVVPMVAMA
jgi:hypothetical protein